MLIKSFPPAERTPQLISQLTQLWRQSVDASHHFLTPAEITTIEHEVPTALRTVPQLLVAVDDQNTPTGFIGIDGSLVAMLFIAPAASGAGIGTALLQTSIQDYGATTLTVNEQTHGRVNFMNTVVSKSLIANQLMIRAVHIHY